MNSKKCFDSIYPEGKINLSFAGCGFLGIYHVGVASCFKKYAPQVYQEKIAGASAGALVACALIADCSLGDCTTFTLNLALECRKHFLGPLSPNFHLVRDLRRTLDQFLPPGAHKLASGRLHVSLTRFPDFQNVLVSQFNSKDDLIDALICSSYVPFYSGVSPPLFQGKPYMDGAFSNNLPALDKWTVKVSPFAGESDICPDDRSFSFHHVNISGTSAQLNCNNAYRASVAFLPPSPEILSQMCQAGFEDALRFLRKNGLISCSQHVSIHSAVSSSHPFDTQRMDERSVYSNSAEILNSVRHARESQNVAPCSGSGEDDDDEDDEEVMQMEMDSCKECEKVSQSSLYDKPPSAILNALSDACDQANKGLRARLLKYKYLTWIAAPYIVPCSITYAIFKKVVSWVPSAPNEVGSLLGNMYNFFVDVLESDQMKLQAQNKEKLISWISFLGECCGVHRCHKKEFYSMFFAAEESTAAVCSGGSSGSSREFVAGSTLPSPAEVSYSDSSSGEKNIPHVRDGRNRNQHLHHHAHPRVPIGKIVRFEDEVSVVQLAVDVLEAGDDETKEIVVSGNNTKRNFDEFQKQSSQDVFHLNHSTIDTHDNSLHIADQMDAILSYCYLEESNDPNPKVNTIEIIPLDYV